MAGVYGGWYGVRTVHAAEKRKRREKTTRQNENL